MLISIIIPCFNQADFLGEAIESALAQSVENLEVIVINDGSTDNTQEVAQRYPEIKYMAQENRGQSEARNRGFYASQGEYIVFLDADDRLGANALTAGLNSLLEAPEAVFTYGAMQVISIDGTRLSLRKPHLTPNPYRDLLANNFIPTPGMVMFRRSVLNRYGLFNPKLPPCEDYDIYLRIARLEVVTAHSEIVVFRRFHANQETTNSGLMLRTVMKVHRRQWRHVYLDRDLKKAYLKGRLFWQTWYGEQVLTQLRINIHQRNWRHAIRNFILLSRFRSRAFWRLLTQTAKSNSLTLKVSAGKHGKEDKHAYQNDKVVKNASPAGITINSISPAQIKVGDPHPTIGNKFLLITVECKRANKCAKLYVDHLPIDTIWINSSQLVGCVPISLLERVGNYEVCFIS